MIYKKFYIKNKKGFSIAQVLAYAVISVLILTLFFAVTASTRSGNINLLDRNELLNEVYNIENFQNEIKYAQDIIEIKNHSITILDKEDGFEKTYTFEDGKLLLTENTTLGVTEIPQYDNIKEFSISKITLVSDENKAIKLHIQFEKNNATLTHDTVIYPNAWIK